MIYNCHKCLFSLSSGASEYSKCAYPKMRSYSEWDNANNVAVFSMLQVKSIFLKLLMLSAYIHVTTSLWRAVVDCPTLFQWCCSHRCAMKFIRFCSLCNRILEILQSYSKWNSWNAAVVRARIRVGHLLSASADQASTPFVSEKWEESLHLNNCIKGGTKI